MKFEEVVESAEVESSEEFEGTSLQIAKRKRTKRLRLGVSVSCNGRVDDKGCVLSEEEEDRHYESTVTTTTEEEEEEDMANCLILLARSGGDENLGAVKTERKRKRICSRKPAEIPDGSSCGMENMYECRTCDKAFHSFQALGGHRASHHKKAKLAAAEEESSFNNTTNSAIIIKPSSAKVHECSICGSAFYSGQALGGHMRRHRAGNQMTPAAAAPADFVAVEKDSMSLLDLNLPAPAEEDDPINQSGIMFIHQQLGVGQNISNHSTSAASALVGCCL